MDQQQVFPSWMANAPACNCGVSDPCSQDIAEHWSWCDVVQWAKGYRDRATGGDASPEPEAKEGEPQPRPIKFREFI